MRQGGNAAQFTQQVDAAAGRVDIAVVRGQDQTGASGAGLLAALLVDVLAAGPGNLAVSGTATVPGGGQAGLQFAPVAVTAR